jgi:hypothetical protein
MNAFLNTFHEYVKLQTSKSKIDLENNVSTKISVSQNMESYSIMLSFLSLTHLNHPTDFGLKVCRVVHNVKVGMADPGLSCLVIQFPSKV